ncbi:unnamed protein product [Adineta ricciae]|uniref:G-protein coupled receptors family 1 profile domain-containing protein n=1 Tax=Adineta ricciae TaxID=249248 RepID=A0A814W7H7_ADIRI|nr:unnamed protein product [Adineta ricciae]
MTEDEIYGVSRYLTNLFSFIILFGGLIGHVIDILVFTSSRRFRNRPSAFFLTIESIVNSVQLIISFSSRIAISGFDDDLTQTSIVWCKLRSAIATSCTLISFTIACFAAINQYLATSYQSYLKTLSTLNLAHYLTGMATIIWSLHGILFLIFMDNKSTVKCVIISDGFLVYITYVYYLIWTGFLPIIIMSVFAVLASFNIRAIVRSHIPIFRRRIDQQLTSMIIARVAFSVIITLPYVLFRVYSLQSHMWRKGSVSPAIADLIGTIAFALFYLNFSVCSITVL